MRQQFFCPRGPKNASRRGHRPPKRANPLGSGRVDRIPLWRGDHVPVKQLVEDFAKYLYLPRLRDQPCCSKVSEKG
jgi:hypothetical protein